MIAAITLPITAISSVYGMNIIVNDVDLLGPARHRPGDHDRPVGDAAALDEAPGLVVSLIAR